MKDDLGARMKRQYEDRTRYFLPRRTWSIIRIDGKTFHTWVKGAQCSKLFDKNLMAAMAETAKKLCEHIQGAQFAYTQSDEISILVTDFKRLTSTAWFDGNIQKIASVSASLATAYFNQNYAGCQPKEPAVFDAKVFTIPDFIEVENYFVWRQKNATRNSIQMVAQSHYSHKELQGKRWQDLHEMVFQKGDNWDKYKIPEKRGTFIEKGTAEESWSINLEVPSFTKDREFLRQKIPKWGYEK